MNSIERNNNIQEYLQMNQCITYTNTRLDSVWQRTHKLQKAMVPTLTMMVIKEEDFKEAVGEAVVAMAIEEINQMII